MEKVAGTDDPDALKDMQAFIDNFSPVLAEAHKFLVGSHVTSGMHGGAVSAAGQQPTM